MKSSRRETTAPPPRPKHTFSAPKLKIPTSPKLPTGWPSIVAPSACAASSMTRIFRPRTSSMMAAISAGLPNRCGTITALVFRVSTASTLAGVRLRSSPQSASTGVAPRAKTGATTAVQQKVGITTSSPARTLQALSASSSAKLPEPHNSASATPRLFSTCDLS